MNEALFFLISSVLPLICTYFIEINYNVQPCNLCVYQRIILFASVMLSVILYFFINNSFMSKTFVILIIFAFLINAGIALYHVGVENGFFIHECSINVDTYSDAVLNIKKQLLSMDISSCTNKFLILGISIPNWNVIYSVCILFIYFTLKSYGCGKFFKK